MIIVRVLTVILMIPIIAAYAVAELMVSFGFVVYGASVFLFRGDAL